MRLSPLTPAQFSHRRASVARLPGRRSATNVCNRAYMRSRIRGTGGALCRPCAQFPHQSRATVFRTIPPRFGERDRCDLPSHFAPDLDAGWRGHHMRDCARSERRRKGSALRSDHALRAWLARVHRKRICEVGRVARGLDGAASGAHRVRQIRDGRGNAMRAASLRSGDRQLHAILHPERPRVFDVQHAASVVGRSLG